MRLQKLLCVGTILLFIFLSSCNEPEKTILQEDTVIVKPVPEPEKVMVPAEDTPPEVLTKTISFSLEKDEGTRLMDGSVPYVHKLKDGRVRLYYCKDKGILSAISKDGLTFTKESGVRVSSGTGFETHVCDPTIVDLPGGKMRIYYKGANTIMPGPGAIHKIYSAISSDGLTFQKEGLRIDSENNEDKGWVSVPDAIVLPDGKVRIYYVTNSEVPHGITSAISSDGLNFIREPGMRVPKLVDPALIRLGDRYLLFAASIEEKFPRVPRGIYYLESSDGLEFGEPVVVFQGSDVYDPSVLKIDDRTIRIFYGKIMPPQLNRIESHTGKITE